MLEYEEAVETAKNCLEMYLQSKGIDTTKQFHCLNPSHDDKKPSMGLLKGKQRVNCLSCGCRMDIFDLMETDYGCSTFKEQLEKVCDLYGIDFSFKKKSFHSNTPKIIHLSDKERELIGLNWKNSKNVPYICKNLSYIKPEKYDKRLPVENDQYIIGEVLSCSSFWFDLTRDSEAYEWIVREKCKEKLHIILQTIIFLDLNIKKDPENSFYKELRDAYYDIKIEIMDIYKRFHGKVSYIPIKKTG